MARQVVTKETVTPPSGALPNTRQHELDIVDVELKQAKQKHRLRSSTIKDSFAYIIMGIITLGAMLVWFSNITPDHNSTASHMLTLVLGGIIGAYFSNNGKRDD